jgi:hypothetical protein
MNSVHISTLQAEERIFILPAFLRFPHDWFFLFPKIEVVSMTRCMYNTRDS